jgi:hypothetical protein
MVSVIDAIAAASNAFRDQEAILRLESPFLRLESPFAASQSHFRTWKALERFRESAFALSETAEKLLFNIGRILMKQSRQPLLRAANGKSCRRAEKGVAAAAP